jgi:hypothetical protein
MRQILSLGVVLLLGSLGATPAMPLAAQGRQAIRGTLAEEGTLQPIGGAFVTVLDEAGERIAGGLSRDDGSFLIDVPTPGTYRLRAERIGFESTESILVAVTEGRISEIELVAPTRAIVIQGLDVEGGRRCDMRPEQGRETLALWEEAKKALDVALWADDDGRFVYDLRSWTRRYGRNGRRLISERVDRRTHVGRHAFRAVSPESLAEEGFVQGNSAEGQFYFAPDAGVLLSEAFLGTHCFEAVRRDDRLGLEFSPVPGRDLSEVSGTLWFEQGSSRLESLEYRYVNVAEAADDRFGGDVVFEELPGGAWIVRRWEIRMPVLTGVVTLDGATRVTVDAVEAAGGEVVEVREAEALLPLGATAMTDGEIRGTVVDSTTGLSLEDAVVFISGTNRSARTEADGGFHLSEVPGGRYTLLVNHPRLSELGITSPAVAVEVQPRAETRALVALPSIRGLVADACERVRAEPPDGRMAALGGVVRTSAQPPAELTVRVTWSTVERTSAGLQTRESGADIVPDAMGRWGVCRIPEDRTVTVEVLRGDAAGPITEVGRMRAGESRWLIVDAPPESGGARP